MKTRLVLFLSLFLFLSNFAHAQLQKGDLTIAATGRLGSEFGNGESIFGLQVNPSIGFFVNDHLLIGSGVSLTLGTTFNSGGFAAGLFPFARYYFNPAAANSHWFAGVRGNLSFFSEGIDAVYGGTVEAGVTQFISRSIALDIGPYYSLFNVQDDNLDQFGLRVSLRAFLRGGDADSWKSASGNFSEGSLMIGGSSANLVINSLERSSTTSFSLQPNVGYFFSDQFLAGMGLGVALSRNSDVNFRSTSLDFRPFARYYLNEAQHLVFFATGGMGLSVFNTENDFFEASGTQFDFFAGAGANLFITPDIALEGTLTFDHNVDREVSSVAFDFGVQFFLNRNE